MLIYEIHSHKEFDCSTGYIERGVVRLIITNKEGEELVDCFFPLDAILYVSHYDKKVYIVLRDKSKSGFNYLPEDAEIVKGLLFELRKAIALDSKIAMTIYAEKISD